MRKTYLYAQHRQRRQGTLSLGREVNWQRGIVGRAAEQRAEVEWYNGVRRAAEKILVKT